MDTNRIRELLDARDKIDEDIRQAVGGQVKEGGQLKERKAVTCSSCGETGHTARSCPKNWPFDKKD